MPLYNLPKDTRSQDMAQNISNALMMYLRGRELKTRESQVKGSEQRAQAQEVRAEKRLPSEIEKSQAMAKYYAQGRRKSWEDILMEQMLGQEQPGLFPSPESQAPSPTALPSTVMQGAFGKPAPPPQAEPQAPRLDTMRGGFGAPAPVGPPAPEGANIGLLNMLRSRSLQPGGFQAPQAPQLQQAQQPQKSPYPEYPDAFLEDGVWKVIKNGKKYRIEE